MEQDHDEIISLNDDDLNVEALERRLELTAAEMPIEEGDCCNMFCNVYKNGSCTGFCKSYCS